jgi:hypothetical protein
MQNIAIDMGLFATEWVIQFAFCNMLYLNTLKSTAIVVGY